MAKVVAKRVTADIKGDFVVFLIGMRINRPWKLHIWHETYRVRAGEYECVYSGMPPFGLAKASSTVDAVGQLESARGRIEGTKVPVRG